MSICNQIITLYGGNFGFELNPIGVKFKFSIPIKSYPIFLIADKEVTIEDSISPKEATLASISPVETAVIKDVSKVDKKLQALVVDDIKTNRQLLARLLKNRNMEVHMVDNGQKAVEFVKESNGKIDIIFMDNFMPVMTGIESADAIREQGYNGLIVGVTGNTFGEDIIAFKEAGADCVLGKQVNVGQLEAIIAHIKTHGTTSSKSKNFESNNKELIRALETLSAEIENLG